MSKKFLKFVAIGDGGCGKTCLLHVYAKGNFPDGNIPTVIDNFSKIVEFREKTYNCNLWDTAGQEEYDKISVVNRGSFENVSDKWCAEIDSYVKKEGISVILVGLKSDLRNDEKIKKELADSGKTAISVDEGIKLADKLGFGAYLECSAQKNEGVKEIFEKCVEIVSTRKSPKKKDCIIQ